MAKFLFPVVTLALFMSFFRLGSLTLFDVDEAVFAEATKEMVQSGDWITPTYDGENRYDKPILFYWMMAVSYNVFGINEFSARLPSAITAFLLALSLFLFLRRLQNEKSAMYAAISMTLSIYFLVYSHAAVTDMALTLFISLSLMSFYLSVTVKGLTEKINWYTYGFYLFSALAFLTKGLIGIVFPFGVAIFFLLTTGGLKGVGRAFSFQGIILFLIVSAPWYAAQFIINGQEFFRQFFIKHHFERYLGVISGHKGPVYYYIPALIVGLLPWIAFLPGGIRNVFRTKDPGLKTQDSKLPLFAFIWFAFIFVFFSLSTTKLPNYILPAIPAVSILISSGMTEQDKWARYSNAFIAVIVLLMGLAFLISGRYMLKLGFHDTGWTFPVAATLFVMAILIFYSVFTKKAYYGVISFLMFAFLSLLSIKAMPVINQYLQGTLHRYSLYAKERLHDGGELITYGINNPSILFYSGHKLMRTGSRNELTPLLQQGKRLLLISKTSEIEVLNKLGFNVLEEDGRYAILEKR